MQGGESRPWSQLGRDESQFEESRVRQVLRLLLVGGIEEADVGGGVIEDLLGLEEAGDFDLGIFDRIGGVNDVGLAGHAVVTAEGAGGRVTTVGYTGHGAEDGNGVYAFQTHYDYGAGGHALHDGGEEGTVHEVFVVFAQDFLIELHHLQAGDNETFVLNSGNYFAYQATFYC